MNLMMTALRFASFVLLADALKLPPNTEGPCTELHSQKNFQRTGSLVHRKFFDPKEIEELWAYHDEIWDRPKYYCNTSNAIANQEHPAVIKEKFPKIVAKALLLVQQLDPGATYEMDSANFFESQEKDVAGMQWHQDYSSFWGLEDHEHYFTFYFPVKYEGGNWNLQYGTKKNKLAPLEVMDRDQFPMCQNRRNSSTWQAMNYNGGARHHVGARFTGYDGDTEYPAVCLLEMKCPLEISLGDLLVFRGDTIHKSGDGIAKKAMSLRFGRKDQAFKKHLLLKESCEGQKYAIESNSYSYLLAEMERRGVDEISMFDDAKMKSIDVDYLANLDRTVVREDVMLEKLRSMHDSACNKKRESDLVGGFVSEDQEPPMRIHK